MGARSIESERISTGALEAIARAVGSVTAAHSGVLGVYLFGSQLSGEATERSDVDLGILFDHKVDLEELIDLESRLEAAIGRPVDAVDVGHCNAFLALEIVRGERIYERDGLACDEFDLYVLRRAADLAPFERERRRMLLEPATGHGKGTIVDPR